MTIEIVPMSSVRKPVPTRNFTGDEPMRLAAYLKSHCNPTEPFGNDSDGTQGRCGDLGDPLGGFYSAYVDRFVEVLNKRPAEYLLPRSTVRRLWESNALPKCQMIAMCTYVGLNASQGEMREDAESFINRRFESAKQADSTAKQVSALRTALMDEEISALHRFGFPELNKELYLVLDLISACIEAIQDVQRIRQFSFSLLRTQRLQAAQIKMARDQALNSERHKGNRASARDLEVILPVLHEAITGAPPNDKAATTYKENNMTKDALRLREEKTIAKLQSMVNGFNEVLPGFMDRLDNEHLKDMPKSPRMIPLSDSSSEILWLSDIHAACTQADDKSAILVQLQAIQEVVTIIVRQYHDA